MVISVKIITASNGSTTLSEINPSSTTGEDLLVLAEVNLGVPSDNADLYLMLHSFTFCPTGGRLVDSNKTLLQQGIYRDVTMRLDITTQKINSGDVGNGLALPRTTPSTAPQAPLGNSTSSSLFFPAPVAPSLSALSQQTASTSSSSFTVNPTNSAAFLPWSLDPLNPSFQERVYEEIRLKNIHANLEQAFTHTPEAFARVTMLYIPVQVNKEEVVALVDSGAQMTIMTQRTAERCGLMRLVDTRMKGVAVGVGSARILGRVHMTLVCIGGIYLPMSITVLEGQQSPSEFILGLDQMKRYQMCIDLQKKALRVHQDESSSEVNFINEGDLPLHYRSLELPPELQPGMNITEQRMEHQNESREPQPRLQGHHQHVQMPTSPQLQALPTSADGHFPHSHVVNNGNDVAADYDDIRDGIGEEGEDNQIRIDMPVGGEQMIKSVQEATGASRIDAAQALVATGWNVDAAAFILFT